MAIINKALLPCSIRLPGDHIRILQQVNVSSIHGNGLAARKAGRIKAGEALDSPLNVRNDLHICDRLDVRDSLHKGSLDLHVLTTLFALRLTVTAPTGLIVSFIRSI